MWFSRQYIERSSPDNDKVHDSSVVQAAISPHLRVSVTLSAWGAIMSDRRTSMTVGRQEKWLNIYGNMRTIAAAAEEKALWLPIDDASGSGDEVSEDDAGCDGSDSDSLSQ